LRAKAYPVWIGRDHGRDVVCFIIAVRPFSEVKTTLTRAGAVDVGQCG
jgi:hypothetical protein